MQSEIPLTNPREIRGKEIAKNFGQVRRMFDFQYFVKSQSSDKEYEVRKDTLGYSCTCPDFTYRAVQCKHIFGVKYSFELRQAVELHHIKPIGDDLSKCIFCNSDQIVKDGVRKNKSGNIQVFQCKACMRKFTFNIGFEKMKHNPQAITSAMQLYFSGESLRHTQKSLELLGVQVSHKTVYFWIRKYVAIMQEYTEKIAPKVSDTWRADEMYVKFRGNMKYLFALMDDQTRFWIAQEVADTKDRHDASSLFHLGKELAGKKPIKIITDGAESYSQAYKKEFRTIQRPRTEHVREIRLAGKVHNNKMERMNGEIRDRERTMRGLKIPETPILKGYQIFHNYIRGHEALAGHTPSEACGVKVDGQDRWKTLIQNASLREKFLHPSNGNTKEKELNPSER